MKIKEKLAEEWAKRDSDLGRPEMNATEYFSFIAGFEKAREMAADVLTEEMKQPKGLSGILTRSLIEQLGEQNVTSSYSIESPWEKMR